VRVFITGATGFIGGYLVRQLAADGHRLRCLVRPTSNTAVLDKCGAQQVVGDVADAGVLRSGMTGCDAAIHLANLYSFWQRDKGALRRVNVEATRLVMEAALGAGVRQVVHVSSAVVFGKPETRPFNEESAPGPQRFSEYARTKYEGDRIAWALHQEQGLPLTVLYPAGVLGPGDPQASGRYIRDILERQLPLEVFPRAPINWVDVRDVATAIARVLTPPAVGKEYILAAPTVSIRHFNELISAVGNVSLPRLSLPRWLSMPTAYALTALAVLTARPPLWGMAVDAMRTLKEGIDADGSKAERELGLEYRPLRQTLEDTIAAFG
jgi:dihydroflavonol-4-reductase